MTSSPVVAAERREDPVRRRLVVSFSGLDGAGKTHQIRALQDHLAAAGRTSEVLWVPFKIWPEPLLNRLPAGMRSRLGPKRRTEVAGQGSAARARPGPARRLAGLVWACIAVLASVSAGLSLRRRVTGSGAAVVILDRYRLDSIVKLQYWYADVPPGLLAGVVRRLAPAPDVEVLLRVPAEVAYERKPEQWSPAQLARQARRYDALSSADPSVLVLDGTDDPERLAAQVRHRVTRAIP